jgi:hypothetical protein
MPGSSRFLIGVAAGRAIANVLLVGASLLVSFVLLEVGIRVYSSKADLFTFPNYIYAQLELYRAYPSIFHPDLGYIPEPGFAGFIDHWDSQVTILDRSVRSNGAGAKAADPSAPVILTVGDSFTFGDEVSDHETWPALLEQKSGYRVINAGVSGYGLDQAILRAERLIPRIEPDLLLVSFIPDDIARTEMAVRAGVAKPYFEVAGDRLVRRNAPVPRLPAGETKLGLLREIAGYSYLLNWAANRLNLGEWWYVGNWTTEHAHTDGPRVACLLMDRLKAIADRGDMEVVLVAQYDLATLQGSTDGRHTASGVLGCAKDRGLEVVDLYDNLRDPSGDGGERPRPSSALGI